MASLEVPEVPAGLLRPNESPGEGIPCDGYWSYDIHHLGMYGLQLLAVDSQTEPRLLTIAPLKTEVLAGQGFVQQIRLGVPDTGVVNLHEARLKRNARRMLEDFGVHAPDLVDRILDGATNRKLQQPGDSVEIQPTNTVYRYVRHGTARLWLRESRPDASDSPTLEKVVGIFTNFAIERWTAS